MRPNKLREKLNAGEPTLSTHILSPWPSFVEILGYTGLYDYVEFVGEYTNFDLHDLDNLCRAAELHGMGSMMKIDQSNQAFIAQRAVGAGFTSLLYTDCRSADDVRLCLRLARPDTPEDGGLYGVANRRSAYPGYGGAPEYVQALRDVVVAVMIEKKGAVEELEEVLSIPGVDMVQWGPADYCMSMGRAGDSGDPDMQAVGKRVFETAIKMGVAPRAEISSLDEAKMYLDMGVRHFSIGTDIHILSKWWRENGEGMREVLSGA